MSRPIKSTPRLDINSSIKFLNEVEKNSKKKNGPIPTPNIDKGINIIKKDMLNKMVEQIINKFNTKQAIIGVIGLGYVGLPLILRFTEVGYKVLGVDIDPIKVDKLNNGESYIKHIESNRIKKAVDLGFKATTNFSKLSEVDALLICVPTPLDDNRNPDLSFVRNTIDNFLPYLRRNQIISLESTTYPGTTEEELISKIHQNN
jgi:UDP-N-acetyl-D-glucosamine dehydrogenase